MKLNDLLKHMYAITLRIIDKDAHKTLFKGHIREIRDNGFKKDYKVSEICGSFSEDVDIYVKEIK